MRFFYRLFTPISALPKLLKASCIGALLTLALVAACVLPTRHDVYKALADPNNPYTNLPPGFYAPGVNFTDLVVSPDGKKVAFEYINEPTGRGVIGLGIYDIDSKRAIRVPSPPGKQLSMPSFSPDGQRLLVSVVRHGSVRGRGIAEVDLRTMQITEITEIKDDYIFYPVYQPETGNILYWFYWNYAFFGLRLLDPHTGATQELIGKKDSFNFARRAFFIGPNEVMFQAGGWHGFPHLQAAREKIASPGGEVAYIMRIGEKPELFSLEAELDRGWANNSAFPQFSVSHDGRVIAFMRWKKQKKRARTSVRELYRFSGGQIAQLTEINHHINMPFMSANAATIAFLSDIDHPRILDVLIYDMRTGAVQQTHLLEEIATSPIFRLYPRRTP